MPAPRPALSTLPVGAGRLGLMRAPCTDEDMAVLTAFAPIWVISLTEAAEMAALGLSGLGERLRAGGIAHAHLPIPDFGVPPVSTLALWQALSPDLHQTLAGGGGVVIHCRGGLGRSGTMAALALMERGLGAADAMAQVRAARPGAIETAEQERWLLNQRAGAQKLGPCG